MGAVGASLVRSRRASPVPGEAQPVIGAGTRIAGRYDVVGLLGRGGAADVFHAHDVRRGMAVAVKVVRAPEADARQRLAAEVRVLRRLRHPRIVGILGSGAYCGLPYVVLELVEGGSLAAALRRGALRAGHVRRIGVALADALAYLHGRGVVHRDVTPGNVLLDRTGEGHLADFGIAYDGGAAVTATGIVIGTASYLPPERLDGTPATPAGDVHALGLVLLECLTGRRAFSGSTTDVVIEKARRDPAVPRSLPAPWPDVLRAATARDPSRRPSAVDVRDALAGAP